MTCPLCKKEVTKVATTLAVAYWGSMFYKIIENKPLKPDEKKRLEMQNRMNIMKQKCFICRQDGRKL